MAKKEERFCIHDVSEYVECPDCDAEDASTQSYVQTVIKELKHENALLREALEEARTLLGWSQHLHLGITGGGSVPEGYIEGPEWRRRVRALRGEGK